MTNALIVSVVVLLAAVTYLFAKVSKIQPVAQKGGGGCGCGGCGCGTGN